MYITLGDVNMPQAGLCDKLVENWNHNYVEGSLQVS